MQMLAYLQNSLNGGFRSTRLEKRMGHTYAVFTCFISIYVNLEDVTAK